MNVCLAHGHVTAHSGSGRYIADLAQRFAEDGHRVTLVCHEYDPALQDIRGIDIVPIPRPSERLWRLGHVAELLTNQRHVRRRLEGRHFDVLLGSDLLFLKPLRTLHGTGVRFIYTPLSMIAPIEIESYDLGGFRALAGQRLYAWLQRWALDTCDRVVRFTPSSVRALERYYGVALSQKALISVYVSREFETAGIPAAGPTFDRPMPRELLWVGRLVRTKNVAFLLRAAALLRSTDWVLNICSDGPERANLEELARTLRIEGKTRFLGAVSGLSTLYSRAALLLTGSVLEQYSLTIMEAYSFGVPCVGLRPDWKTIFNSNEDQIVEGVTGHVVQDESDMARRIDELLSNEPKRQQMGREAYSLKQSGFSFESFFRDLQSAL